MIQELLTLREQLCSPLVFGGIRVAHLFSFLCCVFDLFVFVLCLVYPMLSVSLDCPYRISIYPLGFLWIVHTGLPPRFSLDCPYWITP
jgi:hypothetical protein